MGFRNEFWTIVYKISTIISPMLNTKITYRRAFHKKLDMKHPRTLNEKVLWLKFNTYKDNRTIKKCADKYRVREYLEEKGFHEILPRLITVYDSPDDIDLSKFPDRFAMKLNVGSKCNYICTDKTRVNESEIKAFFKKGFSEKFYLKYSEMQYKGVKPYIIVEEFLGNDLGEVPVDYKFYCFNGDCKYVMLCLDRGDNHNKAKFYFMDENWNMMPFTQEAIDNPHKVIPKPVRIEDAFSLAKKLAEPFPFVRVDLYISCGKIYFGELTFTPSAGLDKDFLVRPNGTNETVDMILGDMLILPQ